MSMLPPMSFGNGFSAYLHVFLFETQQKSFLDSLFPLSIILCNSFPHFSKSKLLERVIYIHYSNFKIFLRPVTCFPPFLQ